MKPEGKQTEGLDRIEFFVDGSLAETVADPPYELTMDSTGYDDGSVVVVKGDAYDAPDNIYQSKSVSVRIDNSRLRGLRSLGEEIGMDLVDVIEVDQNHQLPFYDKFYLETICQDFNRLVVDHSMSAVQERQGVWDFSEQDQVLDFAIMNHMDTRGHPLVWGADLNWVDPATQWVPTPKWVHDGGFNRQQMIEIMYDQIDAVVAHYGHGINEWVVVNEPFGGWEGQQGIDLKKTIWNQRLGDDYVEIAFHHTREIDPDAVLILNEVSVDYVGQNFPWGHPRVDGFYLYVKDLVERGTPIDVVGFEFHWLTESDDPTVADIVDNFTRYGELGLEVYITEMDVRIDEPVTEEKLEKQARLFATAMEACQESEYCTSFAVWSHSDKYTWITTSFPGYGAPTLFDENHQPKAAYVALRSALEGYVEP